MLQMDLIDHVFDNMVVEEALVRIILPEGATNIEVETPYPMTRLPDSLHFTYLDTKGRPVVELSGKNLVENHIQEFKVQLLIAHFFLAKSQTNFQFYPFFFFKASLHLFEDRDASIATALRFSFFHPFPLVHRLRPPGFLHHQGLNH